MHAALICIICLSLLGLSGCAPKTKRTGPCPYTADSLGLQHKRPGSRTINDDHLYLEAQYTILRLCTEYFEGE